ncbi:hypothetical protein [Halorubrum vacuolatum]|uniref:Uncharacterized protein n=1 Tax=Halorubrum vacuolatum TaxID=63740 RepID=A0A238W2J9_HALVU|nr:hypothetical protein [Halorubrum vacuolatum]SNR40756.1 hypothetical protein SAMN06264855_10561 [Halorubrum vacuolatum]
MPLDKPSCPDCGSRFLVFRVRGGGGFFTGNPGGPHPHKCYRCFSTFRVDPATGEPVDPEERETDEIGPGTFRGVLTDVDLDLRPAGSKHAVERFRCRLDNGSDEPIPVKRVAMRFDDGEDRIEPTDLAVVEPDETTTVDIQRSWIHPEQTTVRIRVLGDGEIVGRGIVDLEDHRVEGDG